MNEDYKALYEAEQKERLCEKLRGLASGRFFDFDSDVLPSLLRSHERSSSQGGSAEDVFLVGDQRLSASDALDAWSESHPHHCRNKGSEAAPAERHLRQSPSFGSQAKTSGACNPWNKESWSVTQQHRILSEDPAQARQLIEQAGLPVPAHLPVSANSGPQNPWKKETWSVTLQMHIMATDRAKADRLMAEAGHEPPKMWYS